MARKLNFQFKDDDEQDLKEILRRPYFYDKLDWQDVEMRLDLMHPENMYIIYHSQNHLKLRDEDPQLFLKEKWYDREFTI